MRYVALVVALIAGACSKNETPAQPGAADVAAAHAGVLPGARGVTQLQGKVLEKHDAVGYTYLKLQTAEGELWAAVQTAEVAVGSDVTVASDTRMVDFESKTLGRRFDAIYFGALARPGAAPAAEGCGGGCGDHAAAGCGGDDHAGHAHAQAPAPQAPQKVEKAPGANGRTVSEIFAQRGKLAGSRVAVRGTVTKVSHGILGKNWLHLRDGTGTAEGKDDDLTVTTQLEASVGEVVLLEGILQTDRDIGSGYFYLVLLEDAVAPGTAAAAK